MSGLSTPRLRAPARVAAGTPFEVRVLVAHPMESGFRRDTSGALLGRHIVTGMRCTLDGVEAFRVELGPGIAANPYFSFDLAIDAAAELRVVWEDDDGGRESIAARIDLLVTP